MPERRHYRTPSTTGLTRRMIRLLEREVARLERHYDALEAAPPATDAPASAQRRPNRRR